MRITEITLAETILYNPESHKMDLLGITDFIKAPSFPHTLESLGTSFCIELDGGEPDGRDASVVITYSFNHQELLQNAASFHWPPARRVARQNHRFQGLLVFNEPGVFIVDIRVNYPDVRQGSIMQKSKEVNVYYGTSQHPFEWKPGT